MAKKERARKLPDPEHLLVAQVRESRFSYYISSHHSKQVTERVGDEAIIDIVAEITNSDRPNPSSWGSLSIVLSSALEHSCTTLRSGLSTDAVFNEAASE